jgi:signal transduction histidine kinase/CheY-like chemotaxis protein
MTPQSILHDNRDQSQDQDHSKDNDNLSKQSHTITFIEFLESHQSSWSVFVFYLWYIFIFLVTIFLRALETSFHTMHIQHHSASPLEVLRLVSLFPIGLHLYHHLQQSYFLRWTPQPFHLWQIGNLFIFLVTAIAAFILFYSSLSNKCTAPLCTDDDRTSDSGLQSNLLLQSVVIAIVSPILVKAHSAWCVVISYLLSFVLTLSAAVLQDRCVVTLFTIIIMYTLGTIILYDNEQTLHVLYLNYINHEEHLMIRLKTTNEKELLLMKGEELRYLIGNVAHDLKSPLHGFALELEILRQRLEHSQDNASLECITNLHRISSFLLMTINRAIDFSKVSSGLLLVPSLETIDINATMDWAVKCVSPLNELPIKIEPLSDSIGVGHVITDKHWLMENLLCLLSNAQKFTGEGQITLRCGLESGESKGNIEQGRDEKSMVNWLTPSPSRLLLSAASDSVTTKDSFLPLRHSSSQTSSTLSLNLNLLVRIEVEDSGIGTRPEERAELFLPFKQAQRRVGGTGLGLYSLAKRVEALGGSFGVTDRRDGAIGSLFWFNFPYRPDESIGRMAASARLSENLPDDEFAMHSQVNENNIEVTGRPFASSPRDGHRISLPFAPSPSIDHRPEEETMKSKQSAPSLSLDYRILLVEDSVLIQKTTSRALTSVGCVVDIARHGLECLKMVKEREYDFILMDIQMPVMDGIEATKRLREMEAIEQEEYLSRPLSVIVERGGDGVETKGSADSVIGITSLSREEGDDQPKGLVFDSLIDAMENGTCKAIELSNLSSKRWRHPQVIIGLSANSDSVTKEEALQAGMNEFLSKPLAVSRLKKCFEQISSHNSPPL